MNRLELIKVLLEYIKKRDDVKVKNLNSEYFIWIEQLLNKKTEIELKRLYETWFKNLS